MTKDFYRLFVMPIIKSNENEKTHTLQTIPLSKSNIDLLTITPGPRGIFCTMFPFTSPYNITNPKFNKLKKHEMFMIFPLIKSDQKK